MCGTTATGVTRTATASSDRPTLDYVLADWGQGSGAPGPAAPIPEPATLGIFALCGFAMLRRKPKSQ